MIAFGQQLHRCCSAWMSSLASETLDNEYITTAAVVVAIAGMTSALAARPLYKYHRIIQDGVVSLHSSQF